MSRYDAPSGDQSEFEPGSDETVLKNLLGITDLQTMEQAEFDALLRTQAAYLDQLTEKTPITSKLIRQMHKEWLGGIYAWAGEYRTVEMSKGGFQWPPAYRVEPNMVLFENGLLREYTPCRAGDLDSVALQVAQVHAEFLFIHPFREGNGRLARWIAEVIAMQAGFGTPQYPFWGDQTVEARHNYVNAVKRGYVEDFGPLAEFFRTAIVLRESGEE